MGGELEHKNAMQKFESGATRDGDTGKLDYEGFFCPLVMERYAQYLHKHRQTAAGLRDSDNWQQGIPLMRYMKSKFRHFMQTFRLHRGYPLRLGEDDIEDSLCAELFNTQGYLHEILKGRENA